MLCVRYAHVYVCVFVLICNLDTHKRSACSTACLLTGTWSKSVIKAHRR
jgi:hypothetical protein